MADCEQSSELTFASLEEERDYWKSKALEYRTSLEEVRGEFDDFQESSRELEAELEAQLEQAEAVNKDLLSRIHRLEEENDSLKNKVEAQQNEMFVTVSTLQEERTELLALKETLQKYIRQLEQSNDDLERGKRVTMTSLEDFELKLNQAFERNVILENELDEKQRLNEMCQRLKDEVRDLHAEMTRHNRKKQGGGIVGLSSPQQQVTTSGSSAGGGENSTGAISEGTQHNTTQPTNQHAPHDPTAPPIPMETSPLIKANPSPQGTPMHTTFAGTQRFTPSTRISALNMVGDLLRKVGALESRLASCRTHITAKDTRGPRSTSPVDAPRVKRMHMQRANGEPQTPANLTKITV